MELGRFYVLLLGFVSPLVMCKNFVYVGFVNFSFLGFKRTMEILALDFV